MTTMTSNNLMRQMCGEKQDKPEHKYDNNTHEKIRTNEMQKICIY